MTASLPFPAARQPSGRREPRRDTSFLARFGSVIAKDGIATVPGSLFRHQGELQLTPQLTWFVATLLSFKWTSDLPRPSLRKLADRTGVSRNQLLRYEAKLVDMGLLIVHNRRTNAGRKLANAYDFSPLFARLEEFIQRDRNLAAEFSDEEEPDVEDADGYAPSVVHTRRATDSYAPPVLHTYDPPVDAYVPPVEPHEVEPLETEKHGEERASLSLVDESSKTTVLREAHSQRISAPRLSQHVNNRQLWLMVLEDLRGMTSVADYRNWVEGTTLTGVESPNESGGETVIVRASSTYAAGWLEDHLTIETAAALSIHVGRPIGVRFDGAPVAG